MKRSWIIASALFCFAVSPARSCTIVSGKTRDNVVWVGNNEDFYFDFNTYLNVLPREGDLIGAVAFTYGSPDSFIQGGFNENGLFFDFNALPLIPRADRKNWGERKSFPGGDRALVKHILRKCSTVQDVIELANEYEFDLASAQIHLADRAGNLAVMNEGGIVVAEKSFQVSTNFNVCQTDASKTASCWRYPIAERMFTERGVSLGTIRDILDATQQPKVAGTIYSNVINLATGDAYNYYAGDFANPYHFNLKDLLKQGKKSHLWWKLFPDAPVARLWETYLSKGAKGTLALYEELEYRIPPARRNEILRHLFSSIVFRENKYADARIFFDHWLQVSGGEDRMTNFYQGLVHLTNGDVERAKQSLAKQVVVDDNSNDGQHSRPSRAKPFLDTLRGKKPPGANTRLALKGHDEAKFVCVAGLGWMSVKNILLRTEDGWAADFALPPGKHHYIFLVDGEEVADPANLKLEEIETDDGKMTRNAITVK